MLILSTDLHFRAIFGVILISFMVYLWFLTRKVVNLYKFSEYWPKLAEIWSDFGKIGLYNFKRNFGKIYLLPQFRSKLPENWHNECSLGFLKKWRRIFHVFHFSPPHVGPKVKKCHFLLYFDLWTPVGGGAKNEKNEQSYTTFLEILINIHYANFQVILI